MAREKPLAAPLDVRPFYTHRWRLRRVLGRQFGKLCRIVQIDKPPGDSGIHAWNDPVTVEFQDGTRAKASRMALRPITAALHVSGTNDTLEADALVKRARAALIRGDETRARGQLARALELAPGHRGANAVLAGLDGGD